MRKWPAPKMYCKIGHPLTENNLDPHMLKVGQRRCKICAAVYRRAYKTRMRRARGVKPIGYRKPLCRNGHARTADNLRKGKRDCLTCHRELQLARNRKAGIPPAVRRTREEKLAQKRMWEANRKAKKLAAPSERFDAREVFERDRGICGICRAPIEGRYEIDHIVPLARGGAHIRANVQAAHPTCNRRKWATVPTSNNLADDLWTASVVA